MESFKALSIYRTVDNTNSMSAMYMDETVASAERKPKTSAVAAKVLYTVQRLVKNGIGLQEDTRRYAEVQSSIEGSTVCSGNFSLQNGSGCKV